VWPLDLPGIRRRLLPLNPDAYAQYERHPQCPNKWSDLSIPLAAAVWLGLRLLPRRTLSAAARYLVWWTALIATIALPIAYLPPGAPSQPISLEAPPDQQAPRPQINAPVFAPPQTAPLAPAPSVRSRFPLRIATGTWTRWIVTAWGLTALLMLLRLTLSCFALLRRKRASQPIQLSIPLPRNARPAF
jgi:hypothetical protein